MTALDPRLPLLGVYPGEPAPGGHTVSAWYHDSKVTYCLWNLHGIKKGTGIFAGYVYPTVDGYFWHAVILDLDDSGLVSKRRKTRDGMVCISSQKHSEEGFAPTLQEGVSLIEQVLAQWGYTPERD